MIKNLDAWILRLAAPTGHGTDYIGGRLHKAVPKESRSGAARKQDVQGHYMHVRDGILVEEPPYENDLDYFRETALEIRNNPAYRDYRHLVFFVHGGLGTLDSASSRAAAMIPTFKKHGVYPMFLFWRTGFGAMLGSVLEGILPAVEKRSQDYTEIKDASIERLAKPIGRAIWNDIRRNAQACYDKEYYHHVDDLRGPIPVEKLAWTATQEFLKICTEPSRTNYRYR